MSRPSKRPRLHLLPSVSPDPDGELATARARNDDLLKNRWEHIFARYERDFDGVGDEISMFDDTIVVDNGHIKSMRNARDTGANGFVEHSSESPSKYDGRQLLRAMTIGPSENSDDSFSDNDADEVLNSIETLADNIITNDESSEDDLFDVHSDTDTDTIQYGRPGNPRRKYEHEEPDIRYESDFDSLFDNRPVMRSPSFDDLFQTTSSIEPQANLTSASRWNRKSHEMTPTPDTSLGSLPPREIIDREFIREEIRKAIEEENQIQELKIDPAWRIPIRLPSATISKPVTVAAPPTTQEPEPELSDDNSENHEDDSVWKVANRIRRSKREVAAERNLKRLRAESEDPLQDGFTSDAEQPQSQPPETIPHSDDKHSQSRPTSRSSHNPPPPSDQQSSPPPEQRPETTSTSTDQASKQRASRSGSPPQTQTMKDPSQTKAVPKPKPKKNSKSDSSKIVIQVPTVSRAVAKKRSKG